MEVAIKDGRIVILHKDGQVVFQAVEPITDMDDEGMEAAKKVARLMTIVLNSFDEILTILDEAEKRDMAKKDGS